MATLRARPKAPGNELLSRITNVPGILSFSIWMAGEEREVEIKKKFGDHFQTDEIFEDTF